MTSARGHVVVRSGSNTYSFFLGLGPVIVRDISPLAVLKFLLHISPIILSFSYSHHSFIILLLRSLGHQFLSLSQCSAQCLPFKFMGRRVKIARQKTRLKIPQGVFSPMNLYGSTKARALLDNLAKTAKREKIKQILYNGSATWSSPLDLMVASSF